MFCLSCYILHQLKLHFCTHKIWNENKQINKQKVSDCIDPDGNSDEELDDLRRKLKETEDGRQKEEDKLVMKRQKEEKKTEETDRRESTHTSYYDWHFIKNI